MKDDGNIQIFNPTDVEPKVPGQGFEIHKPTNFKGKKPPQGYTKFGFKRGKW